ncbi:MAG: hypothetical protein ACWGOY_05905 [Anaerolineales bacterium]
MTGNILLPAQKTPFRLPLRHEKWFSGLILLAIFIFILALVQFSTPNLVGNDGYYHVKMAELMRVEGLKPYFPWLPLTILNPAEFSDHHFLFHLLMVPFTFGDLILGAKWSSVIFASFAFISVWWLLRTQHIPFAGLWALGLLVISEAFLYRMSMPRAQSLSLAILVLGLNFLLQKKFWYLMPLSFIYVWLYDAFPLMIVLVTIFILTQWLLSGKLDLHPLVFVILGVTFGLLINPYFPDNIIFGARHLLPKISGQAEVRVGIEWYPYETTQLLDNSPLALIAFLSGVIALGLRNQKMGTRTAVTLFLAIFFGLMLFQSRRFIEYFPPFALVFAAMAWSPFLENTRSIPGSTMEDQPEISNWGFEFFSRSTVVGAGLVIILVFGTWFTVQATQDILQDTKPKEKYYEVSKWLIENTASGTRVFQTDWDDFPRLFFHNTWNTYLVGLDPTYLQIKDPDLYNQWVAITRGEQDQLAEQIYRDFAAEYVLTDLNHRNFIDQAQEAPGLVQVYRDEDAIVFRVQLSESTNQ